MPPLEHASNTFGPTLPASQVVNRTAETLQNLCLELATMGDLKLVERPQNYTLAPWDSKLIRANIKVWGGKSGQNLLKVGDAVQGVLQARSEGRGGRIKRLA